MIFALALLVQSIQAAPAESLVCLSTGEVDAIQKIEVRNTDLTGQVNVSAYSKAKDGSLVLASVFNQNGSLDAEELTLSESDRGYLEKYSTVLKKDQKGRYSIVKIWHCPGDPCDSECPTAQDIERERTEAVCSIVK